MWIRKQTCVLATAAAAALLVAAGCGDQHAHHAHQLAACASETRADAYAAGLAKSDSTGAYTVRLAEARPAPVDIGNTEWDFVLLDASNQPVTGAGLTVRPMMPDHGHGTNPKTYAARDVGGGKYAVGPIDLFMRGYWELELTVERDGDSKDVLFKFCLEG